MRTLRALRNEGANRLAAYSETPALDAAILLGHACGMTRASLLANDNLPAAAAQITQYEILIEQRRSGMPMAYITGTCEFMSLPFAVDSRVLIPRADTETLVETILASHRQCTFSRGLEIGAGSGCISIALAHYGGLQMTAVDISRNALAVARHNAAQNNVDRYVTFTHGDMFAPLTAPDIGAYDFIVSNPPYIPSADIETLSASVRDFEPRTALDGGIRGLDFYERLAQGGVKWLRPGGMIFWEIGHDQKIDTMRILRETGWTDIKCLQDLSGLDRVVYARLEA